MTIQRLFLDVDGVLVNWCKGAHKLHGLDWEDGKWPYRRGAQGWNWNREIGISNRDLFAPMGFDFWNELEWLPDGKQILSVCESWMPKERIFLLTAPAHTRGTVEGRLSWIEREMPDYRSRTIVTNAKHACANPDSILIDDRGPNVNDWIAAGGSGFLLPRPWNSAHDSKGTPSAALAFFLGQSNNCLVPIREKQYG